MKEFFKDAPIAPDSAPPPSIRSYNSPAATSSPLPSSSSERGSSPCTIRPILKPNDPASIRIARTVREGSWANREPARNLVAGNRPRGSTRGSSALAQLCDTAEDGVAGRQPPSDDDVPGSDDSNPGEAQGEDANSGGESSDEEPEEVECLHPTSLVSVILEGAEDLLTLEEAYSTLTLKVREVLYGIGPLSQSAERQLRSVAEPIAEEAPALVRAITRDLRRLMGKVPHSEQSISSTPFRGLQPETRPSHFPPSPGSTPTKKGYSAAEIRYRRETSSVGAAVLRFLAALFNSPRLFCAFTEADLTALLEQVVMIPRTPVLPTPTPKRTYSTALVVLTHLRFPVEWVKPIKDKMIGALDSAWNTLGNGGPPYAFKDSVAVKKEAFLVLSQLIRTYPTIMIPAFASYIPGCLRELASKNEGIRRSASAALSSFVKLRFQMLADAELAVRFDDKQEEWEEMRTLVHRTELHAVNFLKGPTKSSPKRLFEENGERRTVTTEWGCLEAAFKALIGKQEDVAWACSTWAMLTSLMGKLYNTFPLTLQMDHIMDVSCSPPLRN